MSQYFTISQLAAKANVPTSTVRYYERRKLLELTTRSSGNYQICDCKTLKRLLFIHSAQHAGCTLSDSSSLLEFSDGDSFGHLKRPFKF
jgi:DNA-binding transcriptional MerR regulator